jgi:hypothetical protein
VTTAFSLKAREFAEFYRGVMDRARRGVKPTAKEKEKMSVLSAELAGELDKANLGSQAAEADALKSLTPLDFFLGILRNPSEDKELRIRAATLAAPFCHARKGEGNGKKKDKDDAAKEAAKGKFAAGKPPVRLVK